ncbi:hypothetical protein GGU11DRAFT_761549 [Lentinula aff. detonsa]|nr:hypothetical protein GGU11DRAFT_761549 [Lentinula aff. detonsa]
MVPLIRFLRNYFPSKKFQANGFYGSQGILGRISEGYTYLEQKFMRAVKRTANQFALFSAGKSNIELDEWEKDGWTYQAKGLWLSPSADSSPVLSLFRSTNLNAQSADIDTELSFIMILPLPPSLLPPSPSVSGHLQMVNDNAVTLHEQLSQEIADIRKDVRP